MQDTTPSVQSDSRENEHAVSPPRPQMPPWRRFTVGYLILAFLCLLQWDKRSLWLRVDFFSGGYLLMRVLPVLRSVMRRTPTLVAVESQRERWGVTAAAGWMNWALLLTMTDLAVFVDYGHWHLLPGLQQPGIQGIGLLLYIVVTLWKRQVDKMLNAAFAAKRLRLITSGPFKYVRHPYYAAAIVEKIAIALVFASLVGWLLVIPWCFLLVRQVRLEDAHLNTLFGPEYADYSRRTARLVPGIY